MAVKSPKQPTRNPEDDALLNPGEKYAQLTFDNSAKYDPNTSFNRAEEENIARAKSDNATETRDQSYFDDEFDKIAAAERLREAETQQAPSRNTGNIASQEQSPWRTSISKAPAKSAGGASRGERFRKAVFSRRGLAIGGGAGGLVVLMLSMFFILFSPAGILLNFKEQGTRWALNKQSLGAAHRQSSTLHQKLFGDPGCAGNTTRWACRANNGVNETFITRLEQIGFRVVDKVAINDDGTRFNITALEIVRDGEVTKRIDSSNFIELYHTDPEVRATFDRATNPLVSLTRGLASLRVFNKFNIDRKNPVTESSDREQQAKDFREKQTANSSGGSINTQAGDQEDIDQGQRDAINDIIGDVDEDVQSKQDYIENGTDANSVSLTEGFNDTSRLAATAGNTIVGGIKGTAMGWLNYIDNACSIYQVIRILNFTMKALMVAPLMQYFMMFAVTADRIKAGVATPEEVSAMGDALTLPSIEPETTGLTFSDSPGFQMISQGVVTDPGSLTRFATGTTAVQAFQLVYNFMNAQGVSATVCGGVTSLAGQITLITLGLVSCAATIGTGCIAGAAGGAVTGALIAVLAQYAIPLIARAMVGVVTPDPFTDPQRSYGVGNALGAGVSVMGDQLGQGNGFQILRKGDYAQLQRERKVELATIAKADTINDRSAGVFDQKNPMSFTNQLATAMSPHISKLQQGFTGVLTGLASLTQHALADFNSTVSAGSVLDPDSSLADYGGRFCGDPSYEEEQFVTTATCGLVRGAKADTLPPPSTEGERNHPYGIRNLFDWMQDNGYLVDRPSNDENMQPAEMAKGDYKEYIETCVETSEPVTTDGWSLDGSKHVGDQCISDEAKYKRFSVAYQYSSTFSNITQIEENTLGKESNTNARTVVPGEIDLATLYDSSENIACAAGTEDRGVHDGYYDGKRIPIRICEITDMPSDASESNNGYGFTGATGGLLINSRISGVMQDLVEMMKKDGVALRASSGFRTMAHQEYLYDLFLSGRGNQTARPGYSNHQMGVAIDIPEPTQGWFRSNQDKHDFKAEVSGEPWHWSPTGR